MYLIQHISPYKIQWKVLQNPMEGIITKSIDVKVLLYGRVNILDVLNSTH